MCCLSKILLIVSLQMEMQVLAELEAFLVVNLYKNVAGSQVPPTLSQNNVLQ